MKALPIISTISAESILILVESIWIQLQIVSWFISVIWFNWLVRLLDPEKPNSQDRLNRPVRLDRRDRPNRQQTTDKTNQPALTRFRAEPS
jgi:hypothetical protein